MIKPKSELIFWYFFDSAKFGIDQSISHLENLTMRTARKKMVGRSCYYHACARIAGAKDDYLFTDVDKEKGMKIIQDLARLFIIEPVSMCWMGNHWHIVVYSEGMTPSLEETADRYNAYYRKNRIPLNPKLDPEKCRKVGEQLNDISFFMRQVHQRFTFYINRVHNRRGTLWADRFKSTILEGENALWNCVKYIELNAVRANLVNDPADYRFCTWGYFCGSGKHIFGENFVRHMRKSLGEIANEWTDDEVYSEFRGEIARTISYELGTRENLHAVKEEAKKKESMQIRCLRRTRHWTDGLIIGSKAFVQETGCQFYDRKRVLKKQLSSGADQAGNVLHCYRRLRLARG